MLLKIGVGKNTYHLLPNVSSFEYTNKIYPRKEVHESIDDYIIRTLDLCDVNLEARWEHNFDVFDVSPQFGKLQDNQKIVREYYTTNVEGCLLRKLTFVVENRYIMEIFTPYVCYCCSDEGKTIETLR